MKAASTERPALDELQELRREYARKRAEYTIELFKYEARIARLEAQAGSKDRKLQESGPFVTLPAMPLLAPLPRHKGWGKPLQLPKNDPLHRVGNLQAWAEKHGVSYTQVKRWKRKRKPGPLQPGERREWARIPVRWAQVMLKEYGIPLEYWPNGIKP